MQQKYAKTLKQKVEIYANFPTEKFLSKVTRLLNLLEFSKESLSIHY